MLYYCDEDLVVPSGSNNNTTYNKFIEVEVDHMFIANIRKAQCRQILTPKNGIYLMIN